MSLIPQVLVTHNAFPQPAINLLRNENFNITIMDRDMPSGDEVSKVIQNYDAVLGFFKVDSKFLDKAGNRLKVISTPTVGYDHLDISAIKKRGIKVGNTQRVPSVSAALAEIAIFLLLGVIRRTQETQLVLKHRETDPPFLPAGLQWMLGHNLQNKVVGIVGLGNVGQAIAKRLIVFDIEKIVYMGHSRKKAGDLLGAEFVSQDRLLKDSDIVINCVPLTKETNKMFNDEIFGKMKKNAVFINIGRGETVDTNALIRALKTKKIAAAGLDVVGTQILPKDHELLHLPNAIVTPHIGSNTVEARTDSAILAAKNIINGLKCKPLPSEL